MQFQVEKLRAILRNERPWYSLSSEYPILLEVLDTIGNQEDQATTERRILDLYERYISEWDKVRDIIGEGIIAAVH
jgi:hypothetical protein